MLVDQSQYILKSCDAQDHVTAHFIHTMVLLHQVLFHFPFCSISLAFMTSGGCVVTEVILPHA